MHMIWPVPPTSSLLKELFYYVYLLLLSPTVFADGNYCNVNKSFHGQKLVGIFFWEFPLQIFFQAKAYNNLFSADHIHALDKKFCLTPISLLVSKKIFVVYVILSFQSSHDTIIHFQSQLIFFDLPVIV